MGERKEREERRGEERVEKKASWRFAFSFVSLLFRASDPIFFLSPSLSLSLTFSFHQSGSLLFSSFFFSTPSLLLPQFPSILFKISFHLSLHHSPFSPLSRSAKAFSNRIPHCRLGNSRRIEITHYIP